MQKFERAKFEVKEYVESDHYGKFVVEPLERGFGTTLGNALRRVLLSSLPGAAVYSIKVEGVYHEFTSIPGVEEDVTMMILNIKNLIILDKTSRLLLADYVTMDSGTGCVHTAPGFGADDYQTCRRYGMEMVVPVDFDIFSAKFA